MKTQDNKGRLHTLWEQLYSKEGCSKPLIKILRKEDEGVLMLCNLVYLKPFFPEPWTCLHKSNLSANIDSFLTGKGTWRWRVVERLLLFSRLLFFIGIFTVIFNFLIKVIMLDACAAAAVMMGHPVYHHDCLHYSWVSTTIVGHIVSSFKDPCIHNFRPRTMNTHKLSLLTILLVMQIADLLINDHITKLIHFLYY